MSGQGITQKDPCLVGPFTAVPADAVPAAAVRTRHLQLRLFVARCMQGALSLASLIVSAAALSELSSSYQHIKSYWRFVGMTTVFTDFLGLYGAVLVLSIASVVLSGTFVLLTVYPNRRSSVNCCGRQLSCSSYSMDIWLDSIAATAWLAMLTAAAVLSNKNQTAGAGRIGTPAMAIAAGLAGLYTVSAYVSGQLHRELQQHVDQHWQEMSIAPGIVGYVV